MLLAWSKKLCPLMSLFLVTLSCGKKIEEAQNTPAGQATQNQEVSSSYLIQLDGAIASFKNYSLPRSAQFEIPEEIQVKRGFTSTKGIEIAFEVNPTDSEEYLFKCSYSATSNPASLALTGCQDIDGFAFETEGQTFMQRKGKIIQIRFKGFKTSDSMVEAMFGMNWI